MLLCAGTGMAQQVTTLDKLPAAVSAFDASQAHAPLDCRVQPVKPELNFGFRFQTGYILETSLDPYVGGRHHWYILFSVTSAEGPGKDIGTPVYFFDSIDLPQPRQTGFIAENTGAFQVGTGRYYVKWAMFDDVGRVCQQHWIIDAHLSAGERSAKVAMPADTAGDFSWRPTAAASAIKKSRHVTILMDAAMPMARRGGPPTDQWGMLVSMLASLVEQMPEASLRVVAFDTAQQREYFRKDNFTAADINDVAHVANARQRWAVDYQVLQNPTGGWDLLRDLENKEIHAEAPADAVIFLGVPQAHFDKMPAGMPGPERGLRFFYLRYASAPSMSRIGSVPTRGGGVRSVARGMDMGDDGAPLTPPGAMDQPDPLEQSVRHLNGKVFRISSPADFSKALATIGR